MSYLDALKKKGYEVDSLPKGLQKKIKEYKLIEEQIKKANDEGLTDDIEALEAGLIELDKHIEHKINIFDPEKHQKKLAVIAQMNKANPKMTQVADEPQPKKTVEPPVKEVVAQEYEEPSVPEIQVQPEQFEIEEEVDVPVETKLKRKPISKGKKVAFGFWGLSILFAIMGVKMYNKK